MVSHGKILYKGITIKKRCSGAETTIALETLERRKDKYGSAEVQLITDRNQ